MGRILKTAASKAKAMECLLHKAGYPTTVNGHFSAADAQELAKFAGPNGWDCSGLTMKAWKAAQTCRALRRQRHPCTTPRQEGVLYQDEIHALHGRTPTRLTVAAQGAQVVTGDTANRWLRVVCDRLL
jgi:hypothetical protein